MLLGVAIFLGCLGAVFGIIALHECGHFLAGLAAGIPAREMKICLATFPQHVALRDGEEWLHPWNHQRYLSRSLVLIKGRSGAIAYVAGGLIVQTFIFGTFVLLAHSTGLSRLWLVPLTSALVSVPLLYLAADLVFTSLSKRPAGDFSSLWLISPASSVLVTGLVVITHITVLIFVIMGSSLPA